MRKLSNGVGPSLSQGRAATNHWIANTEVTLSGGHKGTKVNSTIAAHPITTECGTPAG